MLDSMVDLTGNGGTRAFASRGVLAPLGRAATAIAAASLALAIVGLTLASAASAAPSFGRHWEMATPTEKFSAPGLIALGLSADGRTLSFGVGRGNGLPGTGSVTPTQPGVHLGLRDDHSWAYLPMNLPATAEYGIAPRYLDSSFSLREHLFFARTDIAASAWTLFKTRVEGPPVRLSAEIVNQEGPTPASYPGYKGASADFKHVVLAAGGSGGARFLATDPPTVPDGESPAKLYESVAGTPPVLRRVDVDDAGVPIDLCRGGGIGSAGSGVSGNAERAVSADGQRIFFTAAPDCVPGADPGLRRIYARIGGTSTVELSGSECDRVADPVAVPPVTACEPVTGEPEYQSASAAGDKVYFLSTDQLVDEDTDTTKDLYAYDFDRPSGQRLTLVSAGDSSDASPGAGAKVEAVNEVSDDGLRVYFVAQGVLTTEPNQHGQTAVDGDNNLYLVEPETGRTVLVATLGVGGGVLPKLADPAGRYLGLLAFTALTPDDTDSSSDLYLFDAQAETLRRVSISSDGYGSNGNGELPVSWAASGALENASWAGGLSSPIFRLMSEDGSRIIFKTNEALQVGDVNNASDVYEWHDGQIGLVSDGQHPRGVYQQDPTRISADGSAVAFSTGRALLPDRDTDTVQDVYVARLGPDVDPFVPPKAADPCVKDACQGPALAPLPPLVATSLTFTGRGNQPPGRRGTGGHISVSKAVIGTRVRLKVNVPGRGRLAVAGGGLRSAKRSVARRGSYTLRVSLGKRARTTLRDRKKLRTTVRVTYMPVTGAPSTKRVSLTFTAATSKKGRS